MMVVDVQSDPFRLSPPRTLFMTDDAIVDDLFRVAYDVSPRDGRFLMLENVAGRPEVVVVLHWIEELEGLVPTDN